MAAASSSAVFWQALGPAILLFAYFFGALMVYAVRFQLRGAYRDSELETRQTTVITNRWLRLYFAWAMRPLFGLLLRSGISATGITLVSLLLALASGGALAGGRFALGGWLFLFSGIFDFFDGKLARAKNQQSPRGNAMDSILDRFSDAAILIGLAWFYRGSWVLLLVLAALVGSQLVSYIRAKGESLGIPVKNGIMQRPERVLILGASLAASPLLEPVVARLVPALPLYPLAVAAIAILALTTPYTAVQRMLYLLSQLEGPSFHQDSLPEEKTSRRGTPLEVLSPRGLPGR